jgi:hypothetical protein
MVLEDIDTVCQGCPTNPFDGSAILYSGCIWKIESRQGYRLDYLLVVVVVVVDIAVVGGFKVWTATRILAR